MRVLVAGASGLIGSELVHQLEVGGHDVAKLTRGEPQASNEYTWDPASGTLDPAVLDEVDAVVNLAGATTGRIPWTPGYKREILYSRVHGTLAIAEAITQAADPPAVFLNGSAVGYYGDQPGVLLTEDSPKGTGFLSDVVEAWEQAAALAAHTSRVVTFRTGVIVGHGGAFTPLIPLTNLGLGVRFGSGRQDWPWIALYDEAAAIRHLLTSELAGPVNLAGPSAATSDQITRDLAEAMHRWRPWVAPAPAVRLLGDAGQDLLLSSQNVSSQKLVDDGFEFRYRTARSAVDAMF